MKRAPSLILVTIDCLRADHVGFLGYRRPTTPFLDALSAESVVFQNAIVAGAPTYYSFPAILASRCPLALGRDVVGLAPREATLTSKLKSEDYSTAAFLAGNPYLSRRFGYEYGFEVFRDHLEASDESVGMLAAATAPSLRSRVNRALARTSRRLGPLSTVYDELYFQYCQRMGTAPAESLDSLRRFPAADVIVDEAIAWIQEQDSKPFFLWLHLMDPHAPYFPVEEEVASLGGRPISASDARYLNSFWNRSDVTPSRLQRYRQQIVALYDAGIRWADTQIARLAGSLQQSGLWAVCIMAITADHGEEFLDHGGRFHPPSRVTEEVIRVPLLIRSASLLQPKSVSTPFSMIDLSPTLLSALNLPAPPEFRGQSRWSSVMNDVDWDGSALVECVSGCTNPFVPGNRFGSRIMAVRDRQHKLVVDFEAGSEALFDLAADPGELRPLPPDAQRAIRAKLLRRAEQHLADSVKSRNAQQRIAARVRDLQLEWANSGLKTVA